MKTKLWAISAWIVFVALSTLSYGQTFTVRPSEYTNGPRGAYANPPYAYDGNLTTASVGSVIQVSRGAIVVYEIWYGFPNTPPGASGMKLNVSSASDIGRGGQAFLSYSLDGGTSFITIYDMFIGMHSQQTSTVSLSNSQDLTKVQVKAEVLADTDGTFESTSEEGIYEIWISGND